MKWDGVFKDMYYKCDDCGKEFEFDDTCFLGPIERMQEEECDPMMDLDCFCSDCVGKHEKSG